MLPYLVQASSSCYYFLPHRTGYHLDLVSLMSGVNDIVVEVTCLLCAQQATCQSDPSVALRGCSPGCGGRSYEEASSTQIFVVRSRHVEPEKELQRAYQEF